MDGLMIFGIIIEACKAAAIITLCTVGIVLCLKGIRAERGGR